MRRCCLQQPSLGSRIIAGKHQHSPWSDQTCQRFHHCRVEDTPSRMAPFWPGIWEHYIGAGKAPIRQFWQNLPDIIIPQTNVLQILLIYVTQHCCNAIDEWLGTNKACIRPRQRKSSQMFAAAKTNFQKNIIWGMRELVSQWSIWVEAKRWQGLSKQALQGLAERATFAPPIETLVEARPDQTRQPRCVARSSIWRQTPACRQDQSLPS